MSEVPSTAGYVDELPGYENCQRDHQSRWAEDTAFCDARLTFEPNVVLQSSELHPLRYESRLERGTFARPGVR